MNKHTPAPWKIAGDSGNEHEAFVIDAESRNICWTSSTLDYDTDEETITEEDKANARLIALAPELLDALQECVRVLAEHTQYDDDDGSAEGKARLLGLSLIAEATGQPPLIHNK